jgi:hypothetical protein
MSGHQKQLLSWLRSCARTVSPTTYPLVQTLLSSLSPIELFLLTKLQTLLTDHYQNAPLSWLGWSMDLASILTVTAVVWHNQKVVTFEAQWSRQFLVLLRGIWKFEQSQTELRDTTASFRNQTQSKGSFTVFSFDKSNLRMTWQTLIWIHRWRKDVACVYNRIVYQKIIAQLYFVLLSYKSLFWCFASSKS